jgi:hypothetical protein
LCINIAMKSAFFALAFFALHFLLSAQNAVLWSDSIVVASTPLPITAPRIALLPDGTPLVFWGAGNASIPNQIWCSRYENGLFGTPIAVVQDPIEPSLFGFGGYDVAVSDSQIFVVFEQVSDGIFLSRSDDGGMSFKPAALVQEPIPGGYVTLSSVVVDGTGNPVVSFIQSNNGQTSYEVRRSADGGFNFGDPARANAPAPGGEVCECCTSDLLASGDSVWLLFRNNNQNLRDIWVSRSTDLADTFDVATDVDATDWQLNFCPIAGPRMARSGDSLVAVWMSGAGGVAKVQLSTLHAGTMQAGQQFGFPSPLGPLAAQAQADVAAVGDTLGVVFLENSKEIVFCHSTNGTESLSAQCFRFAVPNHTLQYPSIAFRDGFFHLLYVDVSADQVLYRSGELSANSRAQEPSAINIAVSPNPARGGSSLRVAMDLRQSAKVDFFLQDAWGSTVKRFSFLEKRAGRREFKLDLPETSAGVYCLSIHLDSKRHKTEKVVLVR